MNLNVPESSELRLRLRDHQLFSIPDAAGMTLECLAGGVWLTFGGDRADHFLQPGERFRVVTSRQAVIQALEDSEVAVLTGVVHPAARAVPAVAAVCVGPAGGSHSGVGRTTTEAATGGWRNIIASQSATRLGLERTF